MTYPHALQYLDTDRSTDAPASATYDQFSACMEVRPPRWLILHFPADRCGIAAAALCRAALLAAGISVGEIADESCGTIADTLLVNGRPLHPTTLKEICHSARRQEQQLCRKKDGTLGHFSSMERCGAVLPLCFAESGCRILLLIGNSASPRLQKLLEACPARNIIPVFSDTDAASLLPLRPGIREAVCPTCESALFRRISDACARSGSRLTVTANSSMTRISITPGAQTLTYRTLTACRIPCGTEDGSRAAMLAIETMLALRRLGIKVDDAAMRRGFSCAELPYYFTPVSIQPPIYANRVQNERDAAALLAALKEFDAVLPPPRRMILDPALPAHIHDLLHAAIPNHSEHLPQSPTELSEGTLILVGSPSYLTVLIAPWQRQLRHERTISPYSY